MALRDIIFGPPDEMYFVDPQAKRNRKVDCGTFGVVEVTPNGSAILDEDQMIRYTGYEVKANLEPAIVIELPDGRFLVSVRK